MNLIFRAALTVLAASLVVVLTSCNPGSSGLFSYIAQETKEVTGSLSKGTVTSMAENADNLYAAGGGKLFSRLIANGTWSAVAIADQGTYLAVASIGNSHVYVLAAKAVGAAATVYHQGVSTWDPLALDAGDEPIDLVPVIGSDGHSVVAVAIVTQTTSKAYNSLYLLGTGSPNTPVKADLSASFGGDVGTKIRAAAFDGTKVYLLNSTSLWTGGFDTATAVVTSLAKVASLPAGVNFSTLLYVSGWTTGADGLYLATQKLGSVGSTIYKGSVSGSTWSGAVAATSSSALKVAGAAVEVTALRLSALNAPCLYVGTHDAGYGELTISGTPAYAATPTATALNTNYDASTLPTSYVALLYVSVAGDHPVFLGTASAGLWIHDAATKKWTQQ